MLVGRVAAALAGVVVVVWTLASAIQTVVVPRDTQIVLTRLHFRAIRRVFDMVARPSQEYETRDRILALFAPVALVLLPGVWVALTTVGFTAIFWGTGIDPLYEAFATSGSSLFTLGFDRPTGYGRVALSFVEAGLGLGLVSLMISYLPTIYSAFRTREALVGMLEVRAGSPPTSAQLLTRYANIGWLDRIESDLFDKWEQWFVDVEESHTSQASLVFFRSPTPYRSWITAAGCVLDSAAIYTASVEHPRSSKPDILIRTGFLALRRIADFYGIPNNPDPAATDPISITRREFDLVLVELQAAAVPLKPDRDQAWRDYAGWRVNYDTVLLSLASMVDAPYAPWSSDRAPTKRPRAALRHRGARRRPPV
ncbi:MAG: hypothetical protein ABIR68_16765 [Ilumatobacteraceae bacterium]